VPLFRLILVAAAVVTALAQFLQERHRLKVIERLPGRQARDYYERTRERDERLMIGLTAVLAIASAAALIVVTRAGHTP
jgi:hypothetical protein